jgi:hypothetical protein
MPIIDTEILPCSLRAVKMMTPVSSPTMHSAIRDGEFAGRVPGLVRTTVTSTTFRQSRESRPLWNMSRLRPRISTLLVNPAFDDQKEFCTHQFPTTRTFDKHEAYACPNAHIRGRVRAANMCWGHI